MAPRDHVGNILEAHYYTVQVNTDPPRPYILQRSLIDDTLVFPIVGTGHNQIAEDEKVAFQYNLLDRDNRCAHQDEADFDNVVDSKGMI